MLDLAKVLWEFKHDYDKNNIDGTFLLHGLNINNDKLGVTPASWEEKGTNNYVLHIEACFYLIATMLAKPFSWSTQQNGHIIQEIVPKKTFEKNNSALVLKLICIIILRKPFIMQGQII